jgi:hypothetical protein
MKQSRKLRLGAVVALGATAAFMFTAAASAGLIFQERFHDEGTFVEENFCDVEGLTVDGAFAVDGRVRAVPHGREGLAYFIEHVKFAVTFTNRDTGTTITQVGNVTTKDLKVTDNGDGTLTILQLGTGNDVVYGPDGKAIARNPGQTRFAFLVDDGGTPADPSDDEFLADLGVVKESTGRTDDFCEAVVPALS